jgi:hypothetical protein
MREELMKQQQVRTAVVNQPSLEAGKITCYFEERCPDYPNYVEEHTVKWEHALFYDVKEHPETKALKLFVYTSDKDRVYAYRKDRVYEAPIAKLDDVKRRIVKLYKIGKKLNQWGTPVRVNHYIDEINPWDKMLLEKIMRLRNWACEHGYPIHEVLDEEYQYYKSTFNQ